jgi:hypothetical protein
MKQTLLQKAVDMQLHGVLSPNEIKLAMFVARHYELGTASEAVEMSLVWIAEEILDEKEEDQYDSLDEEVAEILATYEEE